MYKQLTRDKYFRSKSGVKQFYSIYTKYIYYYIKYVKQIKYISSISSTSRKSRISSIYYSRYQDLHTIEIYISRTLHYASSSTSYLFTSFVFFDETLTAIWSNFQDSQDFNFFCKHSQNCFWMGKSCKLIHFQKKCFLGHATGYISIHISSKDKYSSNTDPY